MTSPIRQNHRLCLHFKEISLFLSYGLCTILNHGAVSAMFKPTFFEEWSRALCAFEIGVYCVFIIIMIDTSIVIYHFPISFCNKSILFCQFIRCAKEACKYGKTLCPRIVRVQLDFKFFMFCSRYRILLN